MTGSDAVKLVPATPEYVLSIFVDWHRLNLAMGQCVDPDLEITFDTTIYDWRFSASIDDPRGLSKFLDAEWSLGYSHEQWRAVLEPAKKRTMRDLCNFIAARAKRVDVSPAQILGQKCWSAGAFFAIRRELEQAGVDVADIAPSTPLHEYTRKYHKVFLGAITRLVPGAMPPAKCIHPVYDFLSTFFICMLLAGLVLFGVSIWQERILLLLISFAAVGLPYVAMTLAARLTPKAVLFGELKTFRDLAECIAAKSSTQQCPWPGSQI